MMLVKNFTIILIIFFYTFNYKLKHHSTVSFLLQQLITLFTSPNNNIFFHYFIYLT